MADDPARPDAGPFVEALLSPHLPRLLDSAPAMLREGWGKEFAGQPVERIREAINSRLASPEYAHLFKPEPKAPGPAAAPAHAPGSVEAVAEAYRQRQGRYPSFGLGPKPR